MLVLTSAIKPSYNTPSLIHFDEKLRLKETLYCLKKWSKVIKRNGFDCVLVDNTLNEGELKRRILTSRFPNIRLLAAPPLTEEEIKKGAGYGELKSLEYVIKNQGLSEDYFIIKSNARYFIRNFQNLYSFVDKTNKIYFYSNLRVDRAETKFFMTTLKHLQDFIEYAKKHIDAQSNIHIEHMLARYIQLIAFGESISLPIEPVIFGVSGRTGKKYKFLNEAWAHNIINKFFRKFR